jgi:hypothetical protein
MKYLWHGLGIIFLVNAVFSQQPPALSTADKVAIQTFEQRKQDASKQYNDASQGELTVIREWNSSHPGWHLNEQTFTPEANPKPEAKQETKPTAPAPQPGKTTPAQTPK